MSILTLLPCHRRFEFKTYASVHGVGREVKQEAQERVLVIVSGFIHDVTDFADGHPGGRTLLAGQRGKDATAAFCGGVYEHTNAAHNVSCLVLALKSCNIDCTASATRNEACRSPAWRR